MNKWARKKIAAKQRSDNQHAAKARKRMTSPRPSYGADRPEGRYANILINFPWKEGENTVRLAVDFAPKGSRIDQYTVDGERVTLTHLCRVIIRELMPQIRAKWE